MDTARAIEHYRVRWDIKPGGEVARPLGQTPERGRQLEEWEELSERLADQDPRIAQALEEQRQAEVEQQQEQGFAQDQNQEHEITPEMSAQQSEEEAQISFRRVGSEWALRAPASEMPAPGEPVSVTRADGTTTTLIVKSHARQFEMNGELWIDAEFTGGWGAAELTPEQIARETKAAAEREVEAKLIEQRRRVLQERAMKRGEFGYSLSPTFSM